jgi:hypothetical protein
VEVNFPYSGEYLMTADLVFANDGYPIEVSVSLPMNVSGSNPQPERQHIYQYPMQNWMKIKGLPLQPNDIYNDPVYIDNQTVADSQPGYPVSVSMGDLLEIIKKVLWLIYYRLILCLLL